MNVLISANKRYVSLLLLFVIYSNSTQCNTFVPIQNHTTKAEIAIGTHVSCITLNFTLSAQFKKTFNAEKNQLIFTFENTQLDAYNQSDLIKKTAQLNTQGITSINLKQEENLVSLTIDFKKEDQNGWIIYWYAWENKEPTFTHHRLELSMYRVSHGQLLVNHKTAKNNQTSISHKTHNVIIDPGHGGAALGAHYEGYEEKTFNLDLAQKVKICLSKAGLNTTLTRIDDYDISLAERAENALKLGGDIFVSIHNNATAAPTKEIHDAVHGIETYYLESREINDQLQPTHFLFINIKPNAMLAKEVINHLRKKLLSSQQLAQSIQQSVLASVHNIYPEIRDNGIKTAHYRVLLLSTLAIPAILVEVGYMSNSNELKKLADPAYRQLVAQGICNGVVEFVKNNEKQSHVLE
jgi:N-acetylmuramoyl-L-alanine amidase